jgi:hypothetical protein
LFGVVLTAAWGDGRVADHLRASLTEPAEAYDGMPRREPVVFNPDRLARVNGLSCLPSALTSMAVAWSWRVIAKHLTPWAPGVKLGASRADNGRSKVFALTGDGLDPWI